MSLIGEIFSGAWSAAKFAGSIASDMWHDDGSRPCAGDAPGSQHYEQTPEWHNDFSTAADFSVPASSCDTNYF